MPIDIFEALKWVGLGLAMVFGPPAVGIALAWWFFT